MRSREEPGGIRVDTFYVDLLSNLHAPPQRRGSLDGRRAVVGAIEHHFQLLIADDDPGYRETVEEILHPHFETVVVESGEEAIEIVERRRIDLVLFDMHMHLLTGLEALRIVKTIRAELPCILMTADLTDELRRDAVLADAFCVLGKPIRRRELLTTITAALGCADDPTAA